ncbi:MAG: polyprenyl diphosphate synthase [Proteobacteria bacterium]|uniref:Ditrans,polycis-undecaprenyl-diphosphate synthase ((2E,6E)-farnesyl-diphosphate specific) n=1 Tax=SAR86 cluster bacterium TaxID=2030880 RepID=A0A937IFS9_9GAMM|nr:di-trans,poly-cis-decaprenylcistransferase [SAR86 cluster bacterium]MBL6819799.1 di-trans,poly-cis-decaprenylcistransferase [SAR86 cluster bacterium]MDA0344425.1 polyprenyl diphosphate synthase [Pseudomonadota bacterium]MDA0899444.1 polyprenyl diphosphate synthase [Pseudomonadota bacterium]
MAKPKSVAIVMDGNRRWAKKNNLPVSQGHRAGIESLTRIVKHAKNIGVKHLVVYAFSTENWNRKQFEVNALMNLINFGADTKLDELIGNEVKLNFIGDLDELPASSIKAINKCKESTKQFEGFTLTVAVNYGGIWDFINTLTKAKKIATSLTEENLISLTSFGDEIDIFIRTGGEKRLSNFLLPNIAYSELFFTEKLWPDFSEVDLDHILAEYKLRKRRFGE